LLRIGKSFRILVAIADFQEFDELLRFRLCSRAFNFAATRKRVLKKYMKFTDIWGELNNTEVTLARVQSEQKILKDFDEFFQEEESNINNI
jgi:hypothetical protein